MLLDSPRPEELLEVKTNSAGLKLIAGLCALLVTALIFAGYTYLRKRHAQQTVANAAAVAPPKVPRGPAKAQILVDEAMLKGSETLIGGTVENISNEKLMGLTVELELRGRKDANVEQRIVAVEPADLEPGQDGRYSVKVPTQNYSAVRFVGLNGGAESASVAYASAPGQKRPPERIEAKTIVVPRSGSKREEFLNSPDNPVRVP